MPTSRLHTLKAKERELAGFILNKLWVDRYWCGGVGGHHLGHTALSNVPKGRPRSEHGEVLEVAEKLRIWIYHHFFGDPGNSCMREQGR